MSVNRREFIKVGAAGLATALSGCAGSCRDRRGELHVRLRGLLLLQQFPGRAVVHAVDGAALEIDNHRPVLRIRKSAIDLQAANLKESRRVEENTAQETWEWDLAGRQIRFHEQDPASDTLTLDTSQPSLPNPGEDGTWKSTLLIPDLKKLSGATQMTKFDASAVQFTLRDGYLEADQPKSRNGFSVVWTFRNPSNNQVVFEQGLTDTALFRCPLDGEPAVIRLDSGTITLASPTSEFISIENMMHPPPVTNPNDPFTLGHFTAFYKLVDHDFEPTSSANPPSSQGCAKCDIEPIFCPPARI